VSLESNEKLVDELLIGAEQAAAGRTLGLTDNQTIDLVKGRNERLRQAQRQQYFERNAREGNAAAALAYLAENEREYQFDKGYDDAPLVQEDLVEDNREFKPQKQDKLRANARAKRKAGKSQQAAYVMQLAEEAAEEQKAFDFGLVPMGDNAIYANERAEDERLYTRQEIPIFKDDENGNPQRVGKKKVNAQVYHRGGQGYEPQGAQIGLVQGPGISNDERRQLKQNDRAQGERVVRAYTPNERAVLENKIKANIEALNIKEGDLGVRNRAGRANLAPIGQILDIGGAGAAASFSDAKVGLKDDSPAYYDAVRMVGPDGQTVGYANPGVDRFLGDVNLPGTANQANAPVLPKGLDWIAQNQPEYRQGEDPQPRVLIMDEMRRFTDRLNGLGYGTAVNTEMRSPQEFEKAVDFVIAKAAQKGDTLYSFDTEAGRNVPAAHPGPDEVLQRMRYTPAEKQNLAYALYQLELANRAPGNTKLKENFAKRLPNSFNEDVRFGDRGETQFAKIKNEKVGRGKQRQGVAAELRKLDDPDAAKPFYAAAADQGAPRARFVPGDAYGMANSEIMERYPKYGEDMIGVRDRFQRDVLLGAGPGSPDAFAQQQRDMDQKIEVQGAKANSFSEERERRQLLGGNKPNTSIQQPMSPK